MELKFRQDVHCFVKVTNLHIVSYNDKTLQDENMLTNMTFPYKTLILS